MRTKTLLVTAISTLLLTCSAISQDRFANVQITSQHVSGSVHMLEGAGGNIGISAGDEGILIIDDQFAPLAEKIATAIGGIATTKIKYLVNTHYHGDHTGSNSYFKEIKGSTIFAHDNVRKRLADKAQHTHSELPVVTYQQGVTFHFNGDTIKVMHMPAGHTDSDSVIWFEQANVLHTGDLFFEGRFPYIDLNGGGTVAGYIKNVTKLISMLKDDTKIIPGHGKLATKADYQKSLDMLVDTAAMVKKMQVKGTSLENIVKQGLGDKYKAWAWNFITEEKWITTLYNSQ
ncbi:MAG: MBL fold metallo-hydrolase [Paraglaciecola sp.]|nr:MBL fold metallo-hydrolase [Paraglaciecola sp.]